jgi:hypothetical protein
MGAFFLTKYNCILGINIMKIFEVVEYITESDYTTIALREQDGNWIITQTNAYKKGLKKYKNNTKVMNSLKKLLDFIKQHDNVPPINTYPPEMNIHFLKIHPNYERPLWGHLQGTRIGLVFDVQPGEINLLCIGTHPDCNVG